jgi:hypothetical protein
MSLAREAMSSSPVPSAFVSRLFAGFALAVFVLLLGSMFVGASAALYATAGAAVIGALMLGYLSAGRRWVELGQGTLLFARPWLWMTAFAALSLLNGKYEPVLGFAALSGVMVLLFRAGAEAGRRIYRRQ